MKKIYITEKVLINADKKRVPKGTKIELESTDEKTKKLLTAKAIKEEGAKTEITEGAK